MADTGNLKGVKPKYPENVTKYGNAKDIVFTKKARRFKKFISKGA